MKEDWIVILIIAILIFAIIGLTVILQQAPALGWILSIIFWIGVIRHCSKKN